MIPCWIIEEHHEAFYFWHQAIYAKLIPPLGNLLLHIDEHSDLGLPRLDTPLPSLTPDRIRDFVYQELSIINFIYPAFYLGIFDRFYWLKQDHEDDRQPSKLYVSSQNGDGKNITVTAKVGINNWWAPDRKCVKFYAVTPRQTNLRLKPAVVLDIDLDFFSCDNSGGAYFEVEITRAAYYDLRDNYYHKARLNLGNELKIMERGEQFFLCTEIVGQEENLRVSEAEITDRVAQLAYFLAQNQIVPAMITICRSRWSSYTPPDQWQFIETTLIDRLQLLYPIKFMN